MKDSKTNIHKNHRQRMKAQFLKTGLDSFSEIEKLEFLLYFAIPQKDTNPIAHHLLDRFSTLSKVLDAPCEALSEIDGMGSHSAILIKLIREISKAYGNSVADQLQKLDSYEAAGNYFLNKFSGVNTEQFAAVFLDSKKFILDYFVISEGTSRSTVIDTRRIIERAILLKASSVIVAHNHLSGIAYGSIDDIELTSALRDYLAGIDVQLIEHYILADNEYAGIFKTQFTT